MEVGEFRFDQLRKLSGGLLLADVVSYAALIQQSGV